MRRAGTLLVLLLSLLLARAAARAEKVANLPAPPGYVDDYAHVFTPAGQAQSESICQEVHDKTRAQIFLVTVRSLEGEEAAPFANELFARWKIREKGTDRGILFARRWGGGSSGSASGWSSSDASSSSDSDFGGGDGGSSGRGGAGGDW